MYFTTYGFAIKEKLFGLWVGDNILEKCNLNCIFQAFSQEFFNCIRSNFRNHEFRFEF